MVYEDFTTYTEVDPNNHITVTAARCTVTDLSKVEDAYVYKDKGVNHFDGDFEHLIDVRVTGHSGNWPHFGVWALANVVDDYEGCDDLLTVIITHDGTGYRIVIHEKVAGAVYGTYYNYLAENTTYYLKIKRDESVGTYGRLYCYVYTDSARTNLLTTLQLDLHAKQDFRYIYAVQTRNTGEAERTISGYCENLDLQEAVVHYKTLTESLSLADSVMKSPSAVKAESLGLSDVYARVYSGHRSFAETLSLTDVVQSTIVALKQLTETISLSDYIAKNVSVVKTETLSLSDVYTRVFNAYRTLSESLTLTDTVQALKVALVTLTETISISDYIIKNIGITKAETISLVDAYSRVLTALRELTEQLAVSDALITSKTLVRELTESISLVDRTLKSIGKELSESVSLSDRITAFKPLVRTLVETLNLIDSLIRFRLRKAVRLRAAVRELPAVREKEAKS